MVLTNSKLKKEYLFFILLSILISYENSYSKSTTEYLYDMPIEELMKVSISSGGFFDIPKNEAPGSIWVLDEKDLQEIPALNLRDILNLSIPGVMVSGHSIFISLYQSRGVPLFDNSTSQFMYDGININSAGSLGVNSSMKSNLLGDIEKLEISTAPSGIVHGNGAINGFMNMVPKTGSSHPGPYLNIVHGTKEKLSLIEAGLGHVYGVSKNIYIYAGKEGAHGNEPEDDLGYKKFNNKEFSSGFKTNSMDWSGYKASINWKHMGFRLNSVAKKETTAINNYLGDDHGLPPELYLKTITVCPGLEIPLSKAETVNIKIPVSFFDWGYNFVIKKDTYLKHRERGVSDMKIEPELVFKTTEFNNHKLAAGIRFAYQHFRSNEYYFRSDPNHYSVDSNADWREYTFFTEDIIKIMPWWTLTTGLRFDRIIYDHDSLGALDHVRDAGVWSPRIASSFSIFKNTMLKLAYQEGFHFPQATEVYTTRKYRPEEIKSYEINILQALPKYGIDLTFNAFLNIYKNSRLANTESQTSSDNKFASFGGEFLFNWEIRDKYRAKISYAYSRPLDISDNVYQIDTSDSELKQWNCYPEHMIKGLFTGRFMDHKLLASLGFEYSSGVPDSESLDSRKIFKKDRYSISCKGEYQILKNLSFSIVAKNLISNEVPIPNYYYDNPWESSLGENESYLYFGLTWR